MLLRGTVMDVRQSSFPSKQDASKLVSMTYFDLYDESAKMLSCEMVTNGVVPELNARIECEGTRIKQRKFGDQTFSVVVRNVRELAPVVPISAPPPLPPTASPASAVAEKKR